MILDSYDGTLTNIDHRRQVRTAIEYKVHPDYNPSYLTINGETGNDIALVRLDKPTDIMPVMLSRVPLDLLAGNDAHFIGHGYTNAGVKGSFDPHGSTDTLLEGKEKVLDPLICSYSRPYFKDMICTGQSDQSTCAGDSGGPLFLKGADPSQDIQLGVTAFGDYHCRPSANSESYIPPSRYTDINFHLDWIVKTIAILGSANNANDSLTAEPSDTGGAASLIIDCPICSDKDRLKGGHQLGRNEWLCNSNSKNFFGLSSSGSVHVAAKDNQGECKIIWTAAAEDWKNTASWYEGDILKMEKRGGLVLYKKTGGKERAIWSAGCTSNSMLRMAMRVNRRNDEAMVVYIDNMRTGDQRAEWWVTKQGEINGTC